MRPPSSRSPGSWPAAAGCFRRYLALGLLLMVVYGLSAGGYLAFVVLRIPRPPAERALIVGWTLRRGARGGALVVWITLVNLLYLLLQIAIAFGRSRTGRGLPMRSIRIARAEFRELAGIFMVVLAHGRRRHVLASALAWSGVGLIAFVPLVGLAVFPLQLAALLVRGLVFEYIGLTALGAYVTAVQAPRRRVPARRRARAALRSSTGLVDASNFRSDLKCETWNLKFDRLQSSDFSSSLTARGGCATGACPAPVRRHRHDIRQGRDRHDAAGRSRA